MKSNGKKAVLICVAGGTASGKTTVANLIKKSLPHGLSCTLICLDSFYRKDLQKTKVDKLHTNINFDHPASFDWKLLSKTIDKLINREPVDIPIYDYTISRRSNKTTHIEPCEVIILEGILALFDENINKKATLKIYVETPDDERFIRRFLRDQNERQRSTESIIAQWREVVRPMHITFIEPQKVEANLIVPWRETNANTIKVLKGAVEELIK